MPVKAAQALAAALAAAQLAVAGPVFADEPPQSGVQPIQSPEGSGTEFTTGDVTRSDIPVANMPPGKSPSNLGQAAGARASEERGGGLLPGQGQFDIRDKVSGSVGKAASAISKAAPGVALGDLSDSDLRGSQTVGAKSGAVRTDMPGLGEVRGPSPKSDAYAGGDRADFSALNPLNAVGDVKDSVGKAAGQAADKAASASGAVKNLSQNALE